MKRIKAPVKTSEPLMCR